MWRKLLGPLSWCEAWATIMMVIWERKMLIILGEKLLDISFTPRLWDAPRVDDGLLVEKTSSQGKNLISYPLRCNRDDLEVGSWIVRGSSPTGNGFNSRDKRHGWGVTPRLCFQLFISNGNSVRHIIKTYQKNTPNNGKPGQGCVGLL